MTQEDLTELTDRQKAVLDFAAAFSGSPGGQAGRIRQQFDMSPIRFFQALNALLDNPAALRHAPGTVRWLTRARASVLRRRGRLG